MLKLTSAIVLSLVCTGCAKLGQLTPPAQFDPQQVSNMTFHLQPDKNSQLQAFEQFQLDLIEREISQRFAKAGYPMNPTTEQPTHELVVSVGKAELTATPTGLSLGLGNSNPRASEFQKAITVAINCTLRPLQDSEQAITLVERKITPSSLDMQALNEIEKRTKTKRFYIENMGSTCHSLLSRLDIRPRRIDKSVVKVGQPGFKAVRIETVNHRVTPEQERVEVSASVTQPSVTKTNTQNLSNTDSAQTRIKKKSSGDWRDQAVQIFNQGDTVILKFGYERR